MRRFYPYISIFIIVSFFLFLVTLKLEVRRLGYELWKFSLDYKKINSEYHLKVLKYNKMTRMEKLSRYAKKSLVLKDPKKGQVIQITGSQIAVPQ